MKRSADVDCQNIHWSYISNTEISKLIQSQQEGSWFDKSDFTQAWRKYSILYNLESAPEPEGKQFQNSYFSEFCNAVFSP